MQHTANFPESLRHPGRFSLWRWLAPADERARAGLWLNLVRILIVLNLFLGGYYLLWRYLYSINWAIWPFALALVVEDIDPDSPAEAAGFQPYDVIVKLEDEPVENIVDFRAQIYDYRPGDVVRIGIIREGRERDLQLRLGRQQG